MKNLFIAIICAIGASAAAQTVVKPSVTIFKKGTQWGFTLNRQVVDNDTSYSFIFRNTAYQELVDMKSIKFDKERLHGFAKTFTMAQAIAPGENVTLDGYSVTRTKTFGFIVYELYYNSGFCHMSEKEANKMIEAINKE